MRIDPCTGCGELIDIASDHKADCPTRPVRHNHVTRDIKALGYCPACDLYWRQGKTQP